MQVFAYDGPVGKLTRLGEERAGERWKGKQREGYHEKRTERQERRARQEMRFDT